MTYKPFTTPPNKPKEPSKTKNLFFETWADSRCLQDVLFDLSQISNLDFDKSDYADIFITDMGKLYYNKTIPNENYDKEIENYKKKLKQYEKDLTKYHSLIKMVDEQFAPRKDKGKNDND